MSNMSSEKSPINQKTPEGILKSTVLRCKELERQSEQVVVDRGDPEIYKQKLIERAKLVVALPQLVQDSVKIGNTFSEDEMHNLNSLAELANQALSKEGLFGLAVLLTPKGSKNGEPNYLEKIVNKLYPEQSEELKKKFFPFVEE